MHLDRIRHPGLRAKITSADQAALLVQDGMTVGMSGFTRAGDCKSVPAALAARAECEAAPDVGQERRHVDANRARGLLAERFLRVEETPTEQEVARQLHGATALQRELIRAAAAA